MNNENRSANIWQGSIISWEDKMTCTLVKEDGQCWSPSQHPTIRASSAHLFQRLGNIYFSLGQVNYAKALLFEMQFYIYNQDIHLYFMIISSLHCNRKKAPQSCQQSPRLTSRKSNNKVCRRSILRAARSPQTTSNQPTRHQCMRMAKKAFLGQQS